MQKSRLKHFRRPKALPKRSRIAELQLGSQRDGRNRKRLFRHVIFVTKHAGNAQIHN